VDFSHSGLGFLLLFGVGIHFDFGSVGFDMYAYPWRSSIFWAQLYEPTFYKNPTLKWGYVLEWCHPHWGCPVVLRLLTLGKSRAHAYAASIPLVPFPNNFLSF
jgi:hypothetical protein